MSERRTQIQVGLLFILSVVVLVWGVLWFKEIKVSEATYEMRFSFPNTSGLVKGDPVEVRGVPSGKVDDISFEDGRAVITCLIDRDVDLYPGTEVAIENVGLMGQKVVAITPGSAQGNPLPPGSTVEGSYDSGLPQLMGDLSGTLSTFHTLAARLDSLLASFTLEDRKRLERTLDNTERATGDLAQVLEQNRKGLAESIDHLNATLSELRRGLAGKGEKVGGIIDGSSSIMARLDTTLVDLETTLARVDGIVERVEAGEGTLGRLLQDPTLHDELKTTLEEARALMKDFRENPRKYFKVSVF